MIDWDNLEMMPGPRWRSRDIYDRERLGETKHKQRGGHKTGKNHSTGKESYAMREAKKLRLARAATRRSAAWSAYLEAARAYWAGDAEAHP